MLLPPKQTDTKSRGAVSIWQRDIKELIIPHRTAGIPHKELAVFCTQLSFLLGAGVTLKEALPIITAQTKGRTLKKTLPALHNRIIQGEGLSKTMEAAQVFPAFMCGFVAIGEMTAQLPRVCGQLAEFYERQAQYEDELTAALVYPAAVTVMMLAVIIIAVAFVLPGYAQVFEASHVAMPALTRGLLALSDFVTENALWLLAGLLAAAVALAFYLRSKRGRHLVSEMQLRLSLYKQGINLQLAQALSLLLGAGQAVSAAIPVCAEVIANVRVKNDLQRIHTELAAGRAFWAVLADLPYIDPLLVGLARVGEETGRLPQTMAQCETYFSQNYLRTLKKLTKLIEPAITIALGTILALVMLAIVLPTFELATAF